jgi:hypothetical protein
MLISRLFEILYSNYDISAKKMFTISRACQPPEPGAHESILTVMGKTRKARQRQAADFLKA